MSAFAWNVCMVIGSVSNLSRPLLFAFRQSDLHFAYRYTASIFIKWMMYNTSRYCVIWWSTKKNLSLLPFNGKDVNCYKTLTTSCANLRIYYMLADRVFTSSDLENFHLTRKLHSCIRNSCIKFHGKGRTLSLFRLFCLCCETMSFFRAICFINVQSEEIGIICIGDQRWSNRSKFNNNGGKKLLVLLLSLKAFKEKTLLHKIIYKVNLNKNGFNLLLSN